MKAAATKAFLHPTVSVITVLYLDLCSTSTYSCLHLKGKCSVRFSLYIELSCSVIFCTKQFPYEPY